MAHIDGGSFDGSSESASRGSPTSQVGIFARSGVYWTISYGGTTFSLKDIKGLSYIQRLLRHPGVEFHVLDLLNEPGAGPGSETTSRNKALSLGGNVAGLGDAGEMLDARAKQDYKRRLLELTEELEDLRERDNQEGAGKVESEIEFLTREIARAVGLGGRARRAGSISERARLSATRTIKTALQKVAEHHPSLGELLVRSVRTGSFCCYLADHRVPITWQFSLEAAKPSVETMPAAPFFLRGEARLLWALTGRTTFVGREVESTTLRRYLERAKQGKGSVVMIGGAPGVGKTRIAGEVGAEASPRGCLVLVGSCYDREDSVPFIPFIEILEAALALTPSPQTFREAFGNDAGEVARLLPQLRRLFPELPPPLHVPPEQSRRVLFNSVLEVLARLATTRPVLLLLEDLHWADEGTLSLFNQLAQAVAKLPVMVVGTYRDNELDPGGPLAKALEELIRLRLVERISLRGLPQNAVTEMLRALSGYEPSEAVVAFIYSSTEGNPFFIEELFRHLLETGKLTEPNGEFRSTLDFADIDVPHSVRLIIGRRLVRLSDETRKILSTAAAIGPSFTFEMLEASARADADPLLDCIEEAESAGLFFSTLQLPEARFQFSHELVRQTVLGNLSAPRRQQLHLHIAEAIERLYPNALGDHVNDLAHHLWQAGNAADVDKTVTYLAKAANRALAQSAYDDSIRHLRNAFDLLERLPDSPERARSELRLRLMLIFPLTSMKGYTATEVKECCHRARELCQQIAEPRLQFAALGGLCQVYYNGVDFRAAQELGERMLHLAEIQQETDMLMSAHYTLGFALSAQAKLSAARLHLERSVQLYYQLQNPSRNQNQVQDHGATGSARLAFVLAMLGYPDQALRTTEEALALARKLSQPYTLAWVLGSSAGIHRRRGEHHAAQELDEQRIALSLEHGFVAQTVSGRIQGGLRYVEQGQREQGIMQIRENLATLGKNGEGLDRLFGLIALARAHKIAGQAEEGLFALTEAQTLANKAGEHDFEAELPRLRGELLLMQEPRNEIQAEQCFRAAIGVAQSQEARSSELSATTSLARLLSSQGRRDEAGTMLAEIYNWFTEGFDTADLKDAKALLEELAV